MDIYIRKALGLQGLTAHWRSDRERGDYSNWYIFVVGYDILKDHYLF